MPAPTTLTGLELLAKFGVDGHDAWCVDMVDQEIAGQPHDCKRPRLSLVYRP